LRTRISFKFVLADLRREQITYRPRRWEVAFGIEQHPLTWYHESFDAGDVVDESPSLNACSADDLRKLYPIDATMADKIIAFRDKRGKISSIKEIQQIEGISKEQIDWLSRGTHA